MVDKYSPTYVKDGFPFQHMECQFFDSCRYFHQDKCGYGDNCYKIMPCGQTARKTLRDCLEVFIIRDNEKFQIDLIKGDKNDTDRKKG